MTQQRNIQEKWFREKGWSFVSRDSEVIRERKKTLGERKVSHANVKLLQSQLDSVSQCKYGIITDFYSEVGASVFSSFFIVFATVPGVQCHEPDFG